MPRAPTSASADEPMAKIQPSLSQSSDDAGFMQAVAQQVQNTMQKKRKEGEDRFLLGARRELERCGAAHAEAFGDVVEEMQAVYDQFTLDYARAEDAIRAKWAQLRVVQARCLEFSKTTCATAQEADRAREKGMVRGMAGAKKAVEDFGTLVSSLTEPAATE